jgi:REP element-mobilizing transposase RayT
LEPGKHYHVFNRGNNRELIFRSEENYRYFLQKYRHYVHPCVETYSYCLMPDHFHFVVRVKPSQENVEPADGTLSPISKAFKDFFISYAKSFNKLYNRTGSLFQYKFKRKEIEKEDYLIRLICYVHANPVAAGLCTRFGDWKFSSYNALVGYSPTELNRSSVLEWFGGRENFAHMHEEFVRDEEADEDFKSLQDF